MAPVNFAARKSDQVDLCALAIMQTAAALQTAEGRAAVEKGRIAYLRHLAEKGKNK